MTVNRLTHCRHCGDEIEIEIKLPEGVTIDAVHFDAYCPCSESEPDEDQIN